MLTQFSRTELLLGKEAMNKLEGARVAVFGIGGVGGYVCEALVRSGVGKLDLIDNDKVCMSNLNRQIIATRNTVGKYKTEVMKSRILEINPESVQKGRRNKVFGFCSTIAYRACVQIADDHESKRRVDSSCLRIWKRFEFQSSLL